jgi:amino acid transporter
VPLNQSSLEDTSGKHGGDRPPSTEGEELLRDFTLGSAASLAFAFISPIVALYAIFPLGVAQVGSGFWLGFPIALLGQLLVALVFAMMVSRFPYEGSLYQWSRMLIGARYGWFAGWTYMWTLVVSIATVAIGAAGFVFNLFDSNSGSGLESTAVAIAIIVVATLGNTIARTVLKRVVLLCISAEIIGSVGVATLLLFSREEHPLKHTLEVTASTGAQHGATVFFLSPFSIAVALCGWAFVGFESAGAIAEEMRDATRDAPRAMLASLLCVGAIVTYSAVSLIQAIPKGDASALVSSADPVAVILIYHFGLWAYKGMLLVFLTAFLACIVGIQATVSRVVWAYGRAGDLPGAELLSRLSGDDKLPVNAVMVTGAAATAFCLFDMTDFYGTLLGFATAGFYIAFAFPILAAVSLQLRGRWPLTPYNLGPWTRPVLFLAACWTVFETVNISWPRAPQLPWYQDFAVPLMAGLLAVAGLGVREYMSRN